MLKRLLMIGAVAASISVGGCVGVGAASAKDDLSYAMGYESGSSPHGVGVLQHNEGSSVEDACWMAYQIKIISQDMIGERSPSESDFRRGCQDALGA
jgi:hypothetical protein